MMWQNSVQAFCTWVVYILFKEVNTVAFLCFSKCFLQVEVLCAHLPQSVTPRTQKKKVRFASLQYGLLKNPLFITALKFEDMLSWKKSFFFATKEFFQLCQLSPPWLSLRVGSNQTVEWGPSQVIALRAIPTRLVYHQMELCMNILQFWGEEKFFPPGFWSA